MTNTRLVLIINSLFFSTAIHANLAQVIKLRGNATYVSNGMREAKKVELNQWLNKDSSILTSDKSFLVLRYKTGSEVTLGPNSKIIVDTGVKEDQQLVNLLVGKFKASVKNQAKTNDNKMIIKTLGAAMGVRGTEFQAGYNPQTKITTLLTYHGAVAMTQLPEVKSAPQIDTAKIEEELSKKAVLVKLGEYSGVSESTKNITPPVKISTEQFTKLKLNETLGAVDEKVDEKKYQQELEKTTKDYSQVKSETISEIRPGGFVDNETGIYLPPPKSSEFDKELSIYKAPEKMGKVDDAGNYIPPVGVKLDAEKGFVIDEQKVSIEAKNIINELKTEVEKQVEKKEEVIIKKKKNLENKEEDVYKKYYDPNSL